MSDKMRVHNLAKELNVPSKTIIQKCQAEGIDSVKNHMSTLSAGLHATILEWFSEGAHNVAMETAKRVDLKKVRLRKRVAKVSEDSAGAVETLESPARTDEAAAAEHAEADATALLPSTLHMAPSSKEAPAPAMDRSVDTPTSSLGEAIPAVVQAKALTEAARSSPALSPSGKASSLAPGPVVPAGPQHVPTPAKLQGPRVVRYEAPERDVAALRRGPKRDQPDGAVGVTGAPPAAVDAKSPDKAGARRRGRVNPRRGTGRLNEAGERMAEWRDKDLAERQQRLEGATGRRMIRRRTVQSSYHGSPLATGPKTSATVHEPVRIKEFCSETGLSFVQLFKVLRDEHNIVPNINMILPPETAEALALSFGIELDVVPAKTLLDDLQEEFTNRPREHLHARPPVVTILGHVDHGKTSLLDAIRNTRVVAGEDGGITQHISSYHLHTPRGAVTFLDTPGHEAFAEMRARGARMTDVVVLVVAADDGIMPQTVEAIRHAQAAKVPIVVALNKIDLGEQNKLKIYGQLTEQGLTPSGEWGGEVDVIPTSAISGRGVGELVEHLADLSSLMELKADPTLPATGTVIEAETKTGVGSVVRVLVQEGTLRVGDCVVCGNASGKVRALLDDRGERISEAGPSVPVEVWGLDDVPAAGDRLYRVDNLQRAKEIATETAQVRIANSRQQSRKVRTLQDMVRQRDADVVPELNIIIKADVDGSVAALRPALAEIPTDEVKLSIRHAAVGPINDSDILLAASSDAIVIAFRVDASSGARRLADMHGVDVRSYRVIYDVCDDIKKALEGLLAPEESIETRGTAEVREVFRLSKKAGVIAGSYVTSGNLERNHLIKLKRDGVIVREGCRIASLRRFKDDVREVRAGMECGIRIEGYDDIHLGDLIESYEVIKTARTF